MKTCLIVGIDSFTGKYVRNAFERQGYNVVGTALTAGNDSVAPRIYKMDLLDDDNIRDVVAKVKPDIVVHLAGISFVISETFSQFYDVHIMGTRNLLSALVDRDIPVSKVILASSSQIYGAAQNATEKMPPSPMNDYAVSKLAMEYMARTWMDRLPIVITRPFNYIGIGQAEHFVIPKVLSAFVRKDPVLRLGRTDVRRDFSDVRFVAQCYLALAEQGRAGSIYNIASGKPHSLDFIIEELTRISGFTIEIIRDERFVRKSEPDVIVGNSDKLMSLGNAPEQIPMEETLVWMYQNENRD
uniref:Nucleoside-diphosphate-sugar epimerase n=1 Tax=Candidatus Kentrum sp. LPFa TaxID=2126335 RepID=A0A450WYM7_9GAMM|nr:MAG: Nucleoside-diphosphate-sugar epimerase [Candidatus Kentron sp. LPFa]VFK35138.1 MAG: Nucleoside-diphosphate-sugar epimerase [Candidatus Kentron sp. LPFa]